MKPGVLRWGALFCLAIALAMVGFVGKTIWDVTPPDARKIERWDQEVVLRAGKVCNAAPYEVAVRIAHPIRRDHLTPEAIESATSSFWMEARAGRVEAAIVSVYRQLMLPYSMDDTTLLIRTAEEVAPGDCVEIQEKFRKGRARFFVSAEPTPAANSNQARQELLFAQTNQEIWIDTDLPLIDDQSAALFAPYADDGALTLDNVRLPACGSMPGETEYAPPALTEPGVNLSDGANARSFRCLEIGADGSMIAGIEDPLFRWLARDSNGHLANLPKALADAKAISHELRQLWANRAAAQAAQAAFTQQLGGAGELPYWFAELSDPNGPTQPGVLIKSIKSVDLYAQPITVPENVWVMKINGHPVFGEQDLMHRVFEHANSRFAGIEKSIIVEYSSGGTARTGAARYFFNPRYFTGNWSGVAAWHGGLDSWGLGTSATASCAINGAVQLFADVLNGMRTQLASYRECRWMEIQRKAIARQFSAQSYEAAVWLAVPFSGGLRQLGKGSVKKGATPLSRAMRTGFAEAIETAAMDAALAPPETPLSRRLKDATKAALVGGSVGVVVGASSR